MTKREPMWSLKEYAEDCVPMTHCRGKAPRYPLGKLKALIG